MLAERWLFIARPDGTLSWRGQHADHPPKELPGEWVLRQLGDADLEDDAVIATLLEDYGAISWPYFDPVLVPPDRQPQLGHLPTPDERDHDWWEHHNDATIEDVRWWLKTARALARIWTETSTGGDPASVWTDEGFLFVDHRGPWAWSQFVRALNVGLRPFRARAEHRIEFANGAKVDFGLPRVGLYSAACHQIFNLVVRDETPRRCENETCGRLFVHQLGGAEYRLHYRSDVRYCTDKCARAEASRQYRRRRAAKKKGGKP